MGNIHFKTNSQGGGVSKVKVLKGKYEGELESPEGWSGFNIKSFSGRGRVYYAIFLNNA